VLDELLGIGGNHRDPTLPVDPAGEGRRLALSLRWILPELDGEVVDVWSGVRARAAGGEPLAREVAEGTWWVGAFAGRGFLRAAGVAEELVRRWSAARGRRSG
jgi:hypothetical protein